MIIKNATIYSENSQTVGDFFVDNGNDEVVDATGCFIVPALVDLNVRLQDGVLNSKNIKKIATSAKKGGVGHIVLNADSTPAIDSESILEFAKNGLRDVDGLNIDLMANAQQKDNTLSNMAILLKNGVLTVYMSTIAKNDIAIKVAEYAKMYDITLFVKAEDNSLKNSGVMLDGDVSSTLGLAGILDLSEVLHVSRMIEIARHFGIKILFKSITSPRSVSLITKAKEDGVKVSCEVSIHHLINSDEACANFNTIAKLDPPLPSHSDMKQLQEMLKNGEIDILTTLHQPNSPVNKQVAFYDASYGCESIENALPLYYTKLVKSGILTMQELVNLTSTNPLKLVGKEVSHILFNPNKEQTVKNPHSLYNDEVIFGEVTAI